MLHQPLQIANFHGNLSLSYDLLQTMHTIS